MTTAGEGTITRFDAADGLGEIQLHDGTVVRFGGTACRDFRGPIAIGLAVRVEGIAPGFGGRLRAATVTRLGETWDEERAVFGLVEPITCDDERGKRVRLVPLDLHRFAADHPQWTDRDALSPCALGSPHESFSPPVDTHPIFVPFWDQVLATATGAAVLDFAPGDPSVGASFLGGDIADVGEDGWPAHRGRPMLHLAQLGADLAQALGSSAQLNVFVSSLDEDDAVSTVVETRVPTRARRELAALPARCIARRRWAPAYPSSLTLSRIARGGAPAFFALWVAAPERTPIPALSVQARYASTFPSVDALGEAIVAGGYGETALAGTAVDDPPYRRLLTLDTRQLPELSGLRRSRDETGTIVAIDYEPTTRRSWMY